jgi:hypothetical protein
MFEPMLPARRALTKDSGRPTSRSATAIPRCPWRPSCACRLVSRGGPFVTHRRRRTVNEGDRRAGANPALVRARDQAPPFTRGALHPSFVEDRLWEHLEPHERARCECAGRIVQHLHSAARDLVCAAGGDDQDTCVHECQSGLHAQAPIARRGARRPRDRCRPSSAAARPTRRCGDGVSTAVFPNPSVVRARRRAGPPREAFGGLRALPSSPPSRICNPQAYLVASPTLWQFGCGAPARAEEPP